MDTYRDTSYRLAELLTRDYSTSFSKSTQLFPEKIRKHIYAIYAFVRIADEIVDTYQGPEMLDKLNSLEEQASKLLQEDSPFSTNPILQSFALTAKEFDISMSLIAPFFSSMRIDVTKKTFNQSEFDQYVYGSAEVVGLMCLKVFTKNDVELYQKLENGASKLGRAYQVINFLRDIKLDHFERGRWYFPFGSFETFSDGDKKQIEQMIAHDLRMAEQSINELPPDVKKAVRLSYLYYHELFSKLRIATPKSIKASRIRVSDSKKAILYTKGVLQR